MIHEAKSYKDNQLEQLRPVTNQEFVVMSNLLARATTKWTLVQTKLFIATLSSIKTLDTDHWITIDRKKIKTIVENNNKMSYIREQLHSMMEKSYIKYENESTFQDGFLFINTKCEKGAIKIKVNSEYESLLLNLTDNFTELYLENITHFTKKSTLRLYLYLCSWSNSDYLGQVRSIAKKDLNKVFELEEDAYWENYGTDKQKFHFPTFENKVLIPAIKEINLSCAKTNMRITKCEKVKDGKVVLGYELHYHFIDKNWRPLVKEDFGAI